MTGCGNAGRPQTGEMLKGTHPALQHTCWCPQVSHCMLQLALTEAVPTCVLLKKTLLHRGLAAVVFQPSRIHICFHCMAALNIAILMGPCLRTCTRGTHSNSMQTFFQSSKQYTVWLEAIQGLRLFGLCARCAGTGADVAC